ncbi:MAG: hypothetical protein JSW27_17115 [Phycisphaerales bacterium]|nr:MAG: hypothetical protein JSW27_17115 [Phycisphaerales bacterium]
MNDRKADASTSQGRSCRTRGHWVVASCLSLVLLLGLASDFSPAQTSMELTRWKEFSYAKDVKEVGGRMTALDAVNRSGFVVLGDGEFARLSGWVVHTTTPEGKEYYQGFVMYDFQDGSSILAKVDASGESRERKVGTIVFVSGTKRFEGITGRGTISSWMPTSWDMYTEIDASYSVSED